jgi:hypothetical protein
MKERQRGIEDESRGSKWRSPISSNRSFSLSKRSAEHRYRGNARIAAHGHEEPDGGMGRSFRDTGGESLMLFITEQQVLDTLTMRAAIDLVDQSFRQLAEGTAINHPRKRLILPGGSILHYMAGGNPDYFGIKVYSSNPKTGAHFRFLLYRSADGIPLANIEANHLGQIRTGAASAVGTKYLARKMPMCWV